jgi:DNA polymerase type B, organellar and viral
MIILNNFKHNTFYYAHNLLFDFLLIIKILNKYKIKFSWIFIEYNLYEVKIFFKNKIIYLRCSYKLIPFPLKEFYPSFSSLKKLYFPYEILKNWEPHTLCINFPHIEQVYHNISIKDYLKIYNINDAKILNEGLQNFLKTLNFLKIPFKKNNLSCSSISFNFYLDGWDKINLNLPKIHKNIINQAYFGGKCEVYGNPKIGEKILHFDFSGMYYNCMREVLPYGDFIFKDKNLNINEPGFYYIEIEYYNNYPILPQKEDKLYFREGRLHGWFWYEEILLTIEFSKIINIKIIYGLISLKNDKILLDFLEVLNKFKDENSIKKQIGKLLINSFYGRLALSGDFNLIELVEDIKNNKSYGVLDNFYIIKKKINKKTKSNIAMAAAIAAKGRIKLYKAQMEVLRHGGRLLYSDTDSIFAAFDKNNIIEDKLLDRYVIFDTSKKDTEILDAVFISSKSYALILKDLTEIVKIKGINTLDIPFYEIKNKFFNNDNFLKINNNQFSKKNFSLENMIISKEINLQNYDKRLWLSNKFDTKPKINYM